MKRKNGMRIVSLMILIFCTALLVSSASASLGNLPEIPGLSRSDPLIDPFQSVQNPSSVISNVSIPITPAGTATEENASLSGAQNTSTSQADVSEQSSGQLTKAPLNPVWLAYQQNRTAGKAVTTATATGNSLGHIPSPVDLSYLKGKMVTGVAQTYAPSYDLRTVGKVTSVKNQNPYQTCWAFATFGSLESYLLPTETRNFSEYNLAMQSGFDYTLNDGGQNLMSTAYLARWGGPVNEADDPYPGGDGHLATDNAVAYTVQKHTQDVYFLPERTSSTDNDNIKWGLTTYGCLDIAIYWNNTYYSPSPATYYNPSTNPRNHDVTLVGWDDNYAATNFHGTAGAPPGNGAFIVKNSWGTSWGDGGYFYLSYYDTSLESATAFTAEPTSNYATAYQYDPLGWVTSYGYSSATAWGANVFTADSSTNPLTAVSFYTNDLNTQYEVYIYTNPTSGPIGGTQHVGPKGTMPLVGYHTVKLASPVPLSAGQRFSVVVKFNTSGYIFPLAVEYALSGYSSGATASSGQSYTSSTGSAWQDITTYDSTMNVCIKAFSAPTVITPPTVTNSNGATLVTTNSATLNGQITSTGGANPTVKIYWGPKDGSTTTSSWAHNVLLGTLGQVGFNTAINGLTP